MVGEGMNQELRDYWGCRLFVNHHCWSDACNLLVALRLASMGLGSFDLLVLQRASVSHVQIRPIEQDPDSFC